MLNPTRVGLFLRVNKLGGGGGGHNQTFHKVHITTYLLNLCADVSIFAGGPEKDLKKTETFLFLEMTNKLATNLK